MDWIAIETFLKDTVCGIILLSVISGAILLMILNLLGRANKGVKSLWMFYKEGRKQVIEELAISPNSFEKFKFRTIITTVIAACASIIVANMFIVSVAIGLDSSDSFTAIVVTVVWIILYNFYQIIYATFDVLKGREEKKNNTTSKIRHL